MATTKATTLAHTLASTTSSTADLNYAKTLNDTGVTSTEFDKLDGLTATTDELNLVDGSVSGPLSHRNMIINGAMQVWQRGTDITCLNNSLEGYNSADRYTFLFNSSCPGTLDVDRSTDTPDGFGYSMKLKCNATATPVASSADYIWVSNRIEAQDLQHLNYGSSSAKGMTLSWYMKSANYTSPISIYIEKPDGTVSYFVKSFTPTTSWARYTMTIPANTNSGHTIANDNGIGLSVNIVLAGSDGGTYEQTGDSTAWGTTQKYYTNTQGNFFSDTNNDLYITGLQLELGSVATPFEHRSYGEELAKCQRYYSKGRGSSNDIEDASAPTVNFPVIMRTGPTCTISDYFNNSNKMSRYGGNQCTVSSATASTDAIYLVQHNSESAGRVWLLRYVADAELQ